MQVTFKTLIKIAQYKVSAMTKERFEKNAEHILVVVHPRGSLLLFFV